MDRRPGLRPHSKTQGSLSPILLPPLLFVMSAVMAFATGTSWGTFAIMLPIGVPMAVSIYALWSAPCSAAPFSATTRLLSPTPPSSPRSDHIDHVNTQLPYALLVAAVSTILYTVAAILL